MESEESSTSLVGRVGPRGPDLALLLQDVKSRVLGPGSTQIVRLGRFELIRRLGAGSMGAVYLARDPELEREVAIKHILPQVGDNAQRQELAERMHREARAMARLQHPQVVTIYEVGSHEGQLFLAMEYIDGTTLREWLSAASRSRAEILSVFLAAAEGLEHAHRAGLVHRDFKPDNVLISREGDVKVGDFGLANVSLSQVELEVTESQNFIDESASASHGVTMTRTGAVLGTPAYMSPEQFSLGPIDARSDQFAFCVSLYEALLGERPFAEVSTAALREEVLLDRRRPLPRGYDVPAWLLAVLDRGLRHDPAARWPSMAGLMAGLRDDPLHRRRRRLGLVAAGLVCAAGLGIYASQRHELVEASAACVQVGEGITASWNATTKQELISALEQKDPELAASLGVQVATALDEYAEQWRQARETACVRHQVEGRWDAQLEQRAEVCLSAGQFSVEALLDELELAQTVASWDLGFALMTLSEPGGCIERERLERLPERPALEPGQVRALRTQFARAHALRQASKDEAALVHAQAGVEMALSLDWPPLEAEARLVLGYGLVAVEQYDEACREFEVAYFLALEHGAGEIAVLGARELAVVSANLQKDLARGQLWLRHARAAMVHTPLDVHTVDDIDETQALLFALAGDHEQAIAIREAQIQTYRERYSDSYVRLASSLTNLGAALKRGDRLDEAQVIYREALDVHARSFGPTHPGRWTILKGMGDLLATQGEAKQAERSFREALAIAEHGEGPNSLAAASVLYALAYTKSADQNEHADAIPLYERSLKIREAKRGPESKEVADTLDALAGAHYRLGTADEALVLMTRAMQLRERLYGPSHRLIALSLNNLAVLHKQQGEVDTSLEYLLRAHEIQVRTLDPEDWRLGVLRRNIGDLYSDGEDATRAREWYERALAGIDKNSEVERAQKLHVQLLELLG